MITREAIEALDESYKDLAVSAMATLHTSGVINEQLKIEEERVLSGAADEPEDQLLSRIRDFRRRRAALMELNQIAQACKEQTNEG